MSTLPSHPLPLVRQPRPARPRPAPVVPVSEGRKDWSDWYLTDEEDMGEGCEQTLIIRDLVSYLTEWARERKWRGVFIGSDQFFAWVPQEPLVRVSPDVYLLDAPPPRPLPASWQTWMPGHSPPRWAVEIVSEGNWRKDYRDAPPKYAQLGCQELVIFDPEVVAGRAKGVERVPFQVFRRALDGGFPCIIRGSGPAYSEELDAWLVARCEGEGITLGLARDAAGRDLVPSSTQAREQAERLLAEAMAELNRLRQGESKDPC